MKITLNKQWRVGGWTTLAGIFGGAEGAGAAASGGAPAAGMASMLPAAGSASAGSVGGAAGAAASAEAGTSGGFWSQLLTNAEKIGPVLREMNKTGPVPGVLDQAQQPDWLRLLGGIQ